ncbi:MAG: hypothetical protein ACREJ8_02225, partial [Candidatus Methylomirabilales bacterium]
STIGRRSASYADSAAGTSRCRWSASRRAMASSIASLVPDSIKGRTMHGPEQSYDRLTPGEMGTILVSAGYLEIFANQRSAALLLKAGRGAAVRVEARGRR